MCMPYGAIICWTSAAVNLMIEFYVHCIFLLATVMYLLDNINSTHNIVLCLPFVLFAQHHCNVLQNRQNQTICSSCAWITQSLQCLSSSFFLSELEYLDCQVKKQFLLVAFIIYMHGWITGFTCRRLRRWLFTGKSERVNCCIKEKPPNSIL